MSRFTLITSLFSQTVSRTSSPRRKAKASLGLESLEGRDLMSVIAGPPVTQPPPTGTLPPSYVNPPHNTLPPSPY
jgi:hypothetical protein